MKVLIPYGGKWIETFNEVIGNEAEVVKSERNVESMLKHGSDSIAIVSGRVPGDFIRGASNLKLIQAVGAGIDKIDRDAVLARGGITVCNSHINAAEVAEYTIMLLLAVAKNIVVNDRELRKGDWMYSWGGPTPNLELRNKTCLLLGLGHIGTEISKRLPAFGMKLFAATRTGAIKSENIEKIVQYSEVEPLVKQADFIILALPLTHESRGLIDTEFLSWMKSTSVFVNISRGAIIDEGALYNALKHRKIQAAALDVWWDYPAKWGGSGHLPSINYPFHELDNVVISPHRAAYSDNIVHEQTRFAAENVLRFIRGETPENIVDMSLGY